MADPFFPLLRAHPTHRTALDRGASERARGGSNERESALPRAAKQWSLEEYLSREREQWSANAGNEGSKRGQNGTWGGASMRCARAGGGAPEPK